MTFAPEPELLALMSQAESEPLSMRGALTSLFAQLHEAGVLDGEPELCSTALFGMLLGFSLQYPGASRERCLALATFAVDTLLHGHWKAP